jgi:hypothetical protein
MTIIIILAIFFHYRANQTSGERLQREVEGEVWRGV